MGIRSWIDDQITTDRLADYLTAPWGHTLGLYRDGSVSVGEDVGREIAEDERPVALAKCPGIDNLSVDYWTTDFAAWDDDQGAYVVTGRHRDDGGRVIGELEDVVRECCQDGDVESEREELVDTLTEDAEEDGIGAYEVMTIDKADDDSKEHLEDVIGTLDDAREACRENGAGLYRIDQWGDGPTEECVRVTEDGDVLISATGEPGTFEHIELRRASTRRGE
jgi:hypothetical protein